MTNARTEIQTAAKAASWRHRPDDAEDYLQDIFKRGGATISISYKSNGAVFYGHYDVPNSPRVHIHGRMKKEQVLGYLQSVPSNPLAPEDTEKKSPLFSADHVQLIESAKAAGWLVHTNQDDVIILDTDPGPGHCRACIQFTGRGIFHYATFSERNPTTKDYKTPFVAATKSRALAHLANVPQEIEKARGTVDINSVSWETDDTAVIPWKTLTPEQLYNLGLTQEDVDTAKTLYGGPVDPWTLRRVAEARTSASVNVATPEPDTKTVRNQIRSLAKTHGWCLALRTPIQDRFKFQQAPATTSTIIVNYDPYTGKFAEAFINDALTKNLANVVDIITHPYRRFPIVERNGVSVLLAEAKPQETPVPTDYEYETVWTVDHEVQSYPADDENDATAYADYLRRTDRGTGIRARRRTVTFGPWEDVN